VIPELLEDEQGMAGIRTKIPAATEAALWTLSNGRCYAPGCPFPVIYQTRPGVMRKNSQIAHIYGVRPGARRFNPALSNEERDSFTNLLILCFPHHSEVDDKKTGEELYPPGLLRRWKTTHEGSNGPALAALGQIDEETLTGLLLEVFTPPVKRLELIAGQLEKTGTLTAESLRQLRQIVRVMRDTPAGPDAATAAMLMEAAQLFAGRSFSASAKALREAADILPAYDSALGRKIAQLHDVADTISALSDRVARHGDW
jgi:hypothetical protein